MNATTLSTLSFNDTQLDIIDRNGQQWLLGNQIAKALGYKDAKSVNRIYTRNSEEFDSSTAQVVNMTPSGKSDPRYDMRIFSRRGAHLIAMFARTDKAKAFRKWVLDVLDNVTQQPALESQTISPAQQRTIQETVATLSAENKAYAKYYGALKTHFKIAKYDQLLASQFDEAMKVLQGVVVEQKAIEQPKAQTVPEDMVMIKRQKIETALIAIDSAAARCDGIHEVERLFAIAEEAQKKAIKALNDYRREAVDAIHTAAYHARHISARIN